VHYLTTVVFGLFMKYCHSFVAVIPPCSPRNKSILLLQATLKAQSYHGETTGKYSITRASLVFSKNLTKLSEAIAM